MNALTLLLLLPYITFAQVFVGPDAQLEKTIINFNNSSNKTQFIKEVSKKSDQNILNYIYANSIKESDPKRAFDLFKQLKKQSSFMFKDLAKVREYEVCQDAKIYTVPQFKKWLKKTVRDITFAKCKDVNSISCINTYINKSKEKLPQSEKIAYVREALAKAEALKNKKLIKTSRQRLEKVSPKFKKNIKKKDYLKVANDFLKSRDFKNAESYFTKITKQDFSIGQKISALKGFSKSEKLQRKYKEYVKKEADIYNYVLGKYNKNKKLISNKLLNKTCENYSRAAWSYTSRKTAEETIKNCIGLLKGKYSLSALYWVQGRIEEEKKNYQSAIKYLNLSLDEKPSRANFKEKVLWYKAWNELKLSQKTKALASLDQLIKGTDNKFTKAKFMFWKAKIHAELKQKKISTEIFNQLVSESPLSYYSLVAHKFLNKKIQYKKNDADNNTINEKIINKLNLHYIDWLMLLGETEVAQQFLRINAKKHRSTFTEKDIKSVFPYYAKTHLYIEFFYLVSILSPERQKNLLKNNPELLFPQPYKDIVDKNGKEFAFNSHIVYSIMRQESAFNPKARSFADAFGLLQLIPEVARKANKSINGDYKVASDLYKPELNIRLGLYYLKQQWKHYQERFVLATASYNATDRAIKSWVKTRYAGDTLRFIEDIPYEETRNYVKLVMRNYIYYKLINSDGEIDFPEYCLDMKKL